MDAQAASRRPLAGRVAIVTGSSRGIGRALALRLADDGAAVVVTGKSEQGTDRLPGSIYEVAEEIEARGGHAMAVRLDVRDDEQVRAMVEAVVAEHGRLDILVNNAGALWWERVIDTPPKRADLIWQVAAEHREDNVAANALWPATPIESYATINWDDEKTGRPEQWRTPEILCDAAMEIFTTPPRELTGRQLIDEDFLRERGRRDADLDRYWLHGAAPEEALWIDGRPGAVM